MLRSNFCVSYESLNYWKLAESKNSKPSKRPGKSMIAMYKIRTEESICNFFIPRNYLSKDSDDPSKNKSN